MVPELKRDRDRDKDRDGERNNKTYLKYMLFVF